MAHGAERRRLCTGGKYTRVRLPKYGWLQSRFACARVPDPWARPESQWDDKEFKIVGLVYVEPGHPWTGPLTPWGVEADVLHEYNGSQADSYSAVARRAFLLDEPVNVSVRYKESESGEAVPLQTRNGYQTCAAHPSIRLSLAITQRCMRGTQHSTHLSQVSCGSLATFLDAFSPEP